MTPGEIVGRYRIDAMLGSGGMGLVYLAEDQTLGRKVALKFLPDEFAADPIAVERFRREARAASALNHPNICTIYEVGEYAGKPFIAMERIEGRTLREQLVEGAWTVQETLAIALEVADALEAAHAAGIVHRDIKPANIVVLARGRAKLLDFGLAKLDRRASPLMSAVPTEPPEVHLTSPGTAVGTVAYMSPEQARGEPLDGRSDLFSFGVVLYEMTTGTLPFTGTTSAVIFHEILSKVPTPPRRLNPAIPVELERVIVRALEKDSELRYQSAADIRSDLKRVARAMESTNVPVPAPKPRRRVVLGALAVLLISAAAYIGMQSRAPGQGPGVLEPQQLTFIGHAVLPAISPDGKYVAYAQQHRSNRLDSSLWVRQTETDSARELVPERSGAQILAVTFTPDGNDIDFVTLESAGSLTPVLKRVSFLGGTPKRILDDIWSPVGWSADGRQMAFIRSTFANFPAQIVIADRDGSNQRVLLNQPRDAPRFAMFFVPGSPSVAPAWSPNDRVIAVPTFSLTGAITAQITFVTTSGGVSTAVPISGVALGLAWMNHSSLLAINASPGRTNQLWRVDYPSGAAARVTNDLANYASLALTADRRTLVTARTDGRGSIWMVNNNETAMEVATADPFAFTGSALAWSGDRLVFQTRSTNGIDLSILPRDGNNPEVIVRNAMSPAATFDRRFIAYVSQDPKALGTLWTVDGQGGDPRQLSSLIAGWPVTTPDNRYVLLSTFSETSALVMLPLDGGDPVTVSGGARTPDVSRRGGLVAFITLNERNEGVVEIRTLPAGKLVRRLAAPPTDGRIRWTPAADGIAYADISKTPVNIWMQPLDGSTPRQVTRFVDQQAIVDFAWSHDGKRLAVLRTANTTDIVLFRGFAAQ